MKTTADNLRFVRWLRMAAVAGIGSAMMPTTLRAVNPTPTAPAGREQSECDATSDQPIPPSPPSGSDCAGGPTPNDSNSGNGGSGGSGSGVEGCSTCESCHDNNKPACIKEVVPIAIAPNEPGLGTGMVRLYILSTSTNDNWGSLKYLEFFGSAQMGLLSKSADSTEFEIAQASGTALNFKMIQDPLAGAGLGGGNSAAKRGYPVKKSGYSLARLGFANGSGLTDSVANATALRQFRSGGGFVDYSLQSGSVAGLGTEQGRSYSFPLGGIEIIRKKSDGTLVSNANFDAGSIRQVKTLAGLIDVVQLTDRSYEVRKYAPQQISGKVNGLYTVSSTAFYVMKVEAPVGKNNELKITKTEGSQVIQVVDTLESNGASEIWKQKVTQGDYEYDRTLTMEPSELGSSYTKNTWDAHVSGIFTTEGSSSGGDSSSGGSGGSSGGAGSSGIGGFTRTLVTNDNAMVSSNQQGDGSDSEGRERSSDFTAWDPSSLGRPKTQKTSKGGTYNYQYDSGGRMTSMVSSFAGGASGSFTKVSHQYSYNPLSSGDNVALGDFKPRTTINKVGDTTVGADFFVKETVNGVYREIKETAIGSNPVYGTVGNVREVKEWYGSGPYKGRIKSWLEKSGKMTKYEYAYQSGGGAIQVTTSNDTVTVLNENPLLITTYSSLDQSGNPVNGFSSRTKELLDVRAWPISITIAVWNGSSWLDFETVTNTYDLAGHLTKKERLDCISGQTRVLLQQEWDGSQMVRQIDEDGITTRYEYVGLSNEIKVKRREAIPAQSDYPAQPEIMTTYSGSFIMNEDLEPVWQNRTETTSSGGLSLTETHVYDAEGRVKSHTDKNGFTTVTAYTGNDLGENVTLPDGGTIQTGRDSEGRVQAVIGTAQTNEYHFYNDLANGLTRETIVYGQAINGLRRELIDRDAADRIVQRTLPAFGGGTSVTSYTYSATHPFSVTSISKTGEAAKIYGLNSVGEVFRVGLSADDAQLTTTSSTDRMTVSTFVYQSTTDGLWRVVSDYVYPTAGSSSVKLIKQTRTKVGGFTGTEIARTEIIDIAGNITVDRSLLSGLIREERLSRPGISDEEVSTFYADRFMSVTKPGVSGAEFFGYDALGRLINHKNPRHIQFETKSYIVGKNQIASISDAAGNVTVYSYYAQGGKGAGKVRSITLPNASVKWFSYTQRGDLLAEWGSKSYPTWRDYDQYGKLITHRTWQVAPSLNADSMPALPPTGSTVTTWNYDPATGFLISKRYSDNKGPDYAYNSNGRLTARLWSRSVNGSRLATNYSWNSFGQLTAIDYADGTPDVAVEYDRLGRILSQGNIIAKSEFTYSPTTLGLSKEDITYDLNHDGTPELARSVNFSQDIYLRATGYQLKNGSSVEAQLTYGYDSFDRLTTVSDAAVGTFNYEFEPHSSLITSIAGPAHVVLNSYEQNRDVLVKKENMVGITAISSFSYVVNSLMQRSNVSESGAAFESDRSTAWSYDNFGQIVSSDSSEVSLDYTYKYDAIGNRVCSANSLILPTSYNYAVNSLNQYNLIDGINPVYDEDGNATAYPLPASPGSNSTLQWDAENRLVSVTVNGITTNYYYDSWNRRVAKINTSVNKMVIYDGWNQIAEYDGSIFSKSYTWGFDISNSLQDAGGVGGLLAVKSGSATYYPVSDGNGNISEYLDSSGAIKAHYEYDSFGNILNTLHGSTEDATLRESQRYRFSTKEQDLETGLYYFGHRYYESQSGSWISRDPSAEASGLNLYGYCNSDPINYNDVLGWFGYSQQILADSVNKQSNLNDAQKNAVNAQGSKGHGDFDGFGHYDKNTNKTYDGKGKEVKDPDDSFDWTRADSDEKDDHDEPYKNAPPYHFQNTDDAQKDVDKAIKNCNKKDFELKMHSLQDSFVHKGEGHKVGPKHGETQSAWPESQMSNSQKNDPRYHKIDMGGNGEDVYTSPDLNNEAWDQAEKATKDNLAKWRSCCGKKKK